MGATDLVVEPSVEDASARQRPARRFVVLVLVLALVGGLVGGTWWWTHPKAFHGAPDSPNVGMGEVRAAGGPPVHIAMADPLPDLDRSVTLTGVEANLVGNTAQAMLSFHVCLPKSRDTIISVGGNLSRWCAELADVGGATISLSRQTRRRPQVIMSVHGLEAGELRVQGIDLSYRYGRQRGTQRVGEYVWIRYE